MKTKVLILILVVFSLYAVKIGNTGETVRIDGDKTGVNVPDGVEPSAIFEIFSEEDGILIPRLTITQRNEIEEPENGLLIYNLDCGNFNYYNGSTWVPFPNLIPFDIDPIIGSATICQDETGVSYTASTDPSIVSYSWSVPPEATITTGMESNEITVDFGSTGGNVCVLITTDCGNTSECMTVSVTPNTIAGFVTGGGEITLGGSTGPLVLSGYLGTVLNWQRRHDGGSWVNISHIADVYSETPAEIGVWDYRALVQNGTCPAEYSTYATVTVTVPPTGDSALFNYTGLIETWTIPAGIFSVEIEAWGAQGGTGGGTATHFESIGGRGARMRGTFSVVPGTSLRVLVGEQGVDISYYTAGGGGGSFVWVDGAAEPLIVAGGGGGGGGIASSGAVNNLGIDAVITQNGTDGNNAPGGAGTGGHGGVPVPDGGSGYGGGGCGWYSNGANGFASGSSSAGGGTRPLEGGAGGAPGGNTSYNTRGGFGGGGGAQGVPNTAGAGGGGGYSGGGGGKRESLPEGWQYSGGGGGGSFNAGTSQSNSPGVREGNGRVVIRW